MSVNANRPVCASENEPPPYGRPRSSPPTDDASGVEADLDAVLEAIRAGTVTHKGLAGTLDLRPRTLARRVNELVERGLIERTQPFRSSRQSYRLTNSEES